LLKKVERKLSRKHRFHIRGHAIQFHGECARCARCAR
jgi:Fe2+ or Zn2+ uptake regulation protein